MRVVVTGGAGFIGANLCRALQSYGMDEVVVIDDLSTGSLSNLAGIDVELVQGSILERGLLTEAMAGADCVVHLAARPSVPRSLEDPIASHEVNTTGTAYVLEAARKVTAHVIVASSSSVYGSTVELPKHENLPPQPINPYGATKLAAESYALAWGHSFGLPVLAFRFFNVFGPLQPAGHAYAAVIPAFIDASLHDQPLKVYGDGHQTRDFTFVGNVVDLLTDAVDRRVTCDTPVNLAFGTRTSLREVVTLLSELLDRPVEVENLAPRAGDIAHSQADDSLLRQLFPNARPIDLRAGLEATLGWFREAGVSRS